MRCASIQKNLKLILATYFNSDSPYLRQTDGILYLPCWFIIQKIDWKCRKNHTFGWIDEENINVPPFLLLQWFNFKHMET